MPQQIHQKLSTSRAFSPSENSAFQLITSGREMTAAAQFQPGKMVTSTPVKTREGQSLAEARQRRAQHFRNCFNPPALSTFQPGQPGSSVVHSHWSRTFITALSLVESFPSDASNLMP